MGEDLEIHGLARQLAVLEERMETMSERYDKGWALLREDIAKRDAEAARRETRLILAMAGMIAAGVALIALLLAAFEFGIPG